MAPAVGISPAAGAHAPGKDDKVDEIRLFLTISPPQTISEVSYVGRTLWTSWADEELLMGEEFLSISP